jgi:NHS family xanthosine MFS transporter
MNIKYRLIAMNFLEFFVWGAWLTTMGKYMGTLGFTGGQVASVYGTMGIASMFMPGLLGIVADRWVNAEKLLGICHLTGAALLIWASTIRDYPTLYIVMLLNNMFYMPTIALNNTVSYIVLEKNGYNIVKIFPPIRVWGTVGFIAAMWTIDFSGLVASPQQLYVSAAAGILLGIYAFSMPSCPPVPTGKKKSVTAALGLDAFVLFRQPRMAIFFLFSLLLGAALQITNTFAVPFLGDFSGSYAGTFAVNHPNLLTSVSQISETLFILTIPFFLGRFGIKRVMLMSLFAWVFRFGFFAIGNPGNGLAFLVLSMIIYGMAFDFFNISGSLFIEKEAPITIRASAQGLFMVMTNGLGAFLGSFGAGWVVDHFTLDKVKDWQSIWFTFAGYALVLGIVFPLVFRYRHTAVDGPAPALQH